MTRFCICVGMQLWKASEYSKILSASCLCMQALHKVLNMLEYGWIMPYGRVLNMLGNASQGFASGSKFARTQNMVRLWICDGCTGWVCLNKPDYALKMSQFLNNVEYDWIRWYIPKKTESLYARILNVSDAVHSTRSLCKLLSSYRDRHIQNTIKHLRWSVLQKE